MKIDDLVEGKINLSQLVIQGEYDELKRFPTNMIRNGFKTAAERILADAEPILPTDVEVECFMVDNNIRANITVNVPNNECVHVDFDGKLYRILTDMSSARMGNFRDVKSNLTSAMHRADELIYAIETFRREEKAKQG